MATVKRTFTITCYTCQNALVGQATLEPHEVMSWMLKYHEVAPHIRHAFKVLVDEQESVTDGPHKVAIKCLLCYPYPEKQAMSYREHKAPLELVGALTLMMHTRHEGHPLEVAIDGQKIGE